MVHDLMIYPEAREGMHAQRRPCMAALWQAGQRTRSTSTHRDARTWDLGSCASLFSQFYAVDNRPHPRGRDKLSASAMGGGVGMRQMLALLAGLGCCCAGASAELLTVAVRSSREPCTLGGPTGSAATTLHPYLSGRSSNTAQGQQPEGQHSVRFMRPDGPAGQYILACPGMADRTFGHADQGNRSALSPVSVGPNQQHLVAGNRTWLPLGINIAWPTTSKKVSVLDYYEPYFEGMAAAGGNFARVWLGPCLNQTSSYNPLMLLKTDGAPGSAPQIDLEAAAVLDHLLDLAASYGIRLLIALDSFNSLCPPSVSQYCLYEHSVWSALLARHGKLGFLEFWQ